MCNRSSQFFVVVLCSGCRIPAAAPHPHRCAQAWAAGAVAAPFWELLVLAYVNLIYTRDRTCFIATNSSETLDWGVWLRSGFRHPTGLCEPSQRAERHGHTATDPGALGHSVPWRAQQSPNAWRVCHDDTRRLSSHACLAFASNRLLVDSFRSKQSEVLFHRKARK